ncbi:MAG: hypothetical protein Q4B32_11675 [Clostridia bacterium]|nr:hypothetical protein [Clostridia bacterium]
MRLIDADALLEQLKGEEKRWIQEDEPALVAGMVMAICKVEQAPTIEGEELDAVDCEWLLEQEY